MVLCPVSPFVTNLSAIQGEYITFVFWSVQTRLNGIGQPLSPSHVILLGKGAKQKGNLIERGTGGVGGGVSDDKKTNPPF